MMYLVDTNIFLEILLKQDKCELCKNFLDDNIGSITISDFALHSIGIILLRYEEGNILQKFFIDLLSGHQNFLWAPPIYSTLDLIVVYVIKY